MSDRERLERCTCCGLSINNGGCARECPVALGTAPSDAELRVKWREAGGSFHGPNVETGTMPEAKLLPFLRGLIMEQREEEEHGTNLRERMSSILRRTANALHGGPLKDGFWSWHNLPEIATYLKIQSRRDGDWIDQFGACKLCGGEIPYGHQDHCEIYKLERKVAAAEKASKEKT